MFNWFRKKIDVIVNDTKVSDDLNFNMEEGVSCLLGKILDSLRFEFDQWERGFRYAESICMKRKTDEVVVIINDLYPSSYIGTIKIEDSSFSLNHNACLQFLAVLNDEENKKIQLKKTEILKKWGCK